ISFDGEEQVGRRASLDRGIPPALFDDDDTQGFESDCHPLLGAASSLGQNPLQPVPNTQVLEAVEQALSNIMERDSTQTAESLRASLLADSGGNASMLAGPPAPVKDPLDDNKMALPSRVGGKLSLESLGLIGSASRTGVFVDQDLFG